MRNCIGAGGENTSETSGKSPGNQNHSENADRSPSEDTSGYIRTSDILQGLTDEQRRIVEPDKLKVVVTADAGAAKTEVLVRRIAFDIATGRVPATVPIVTFSKKAAEELWGRFNGLVASVSQLRISTLHALCLDIIKTHFKEFDFSSKPCVLDDREKRSFFRQQLEVHGEYDHQRHDDLMSAYSLAQNKSRGSDDDWMSHLSIPSSVVSEIIDAYRTYKTSLRKIDYEDMQILVADVLTTNATLLEKIRKGFPAIYIDEAQDCSEIQWDIIQLLDAPRVFVVGDKKQQIYSWRGSCKDFESKIPGAACYPLEQNWRSTPQIVAVANEVFGSKSFSKNPDGPKPFVMSSWDQYAEAIEVVKLIEKLNGYGSIGILARNWKYLLPIHMLLSFKGIPHKNNDGLRVSDSFNRFMAIAKWTYTQDPYFLQGCLDALELSKVPDASGKKDQQPLLDGISDFFDKNREQQMISRLKKIHTSKYADHEFFGVLYNDFYKEFIQSDHKLTTIQEKFNRYKCDISFQLPSTESKGNEITLSSVHSVKSGKFTNVFAVGLTEGTFPDFRQEDLEEEERLFYVAITRPEHRLFFSFPMKDRYGNNTKRSLLISTIDKPHLVSYNIPAIFESPNRPKVATVNQECGQALQNQPEIDEDGVI